MNLGLAVWEWQEDESDKCVHVDVGGLELAVQNPEKGGDQDRAWERHLAKWLGTKAQRTDSRARRPREGDLGNWKGSKESDCS